MDYILIAKIAAVILALLAVTGIIASLAVAMYECRNIWKPREKDSLCYSYLCGSGLYRRKHVFQKAFARLYDHTWFPVSAANCAYLLGRKSPRSAFVTFFLAIFYIVAALIGFAEMAIRCIAGTILFSVLYAIITVVCIVFQIASTVLIPLYRSVDIMTCGEQHCPECYKQFRIPAFVCPQCGTEHKELVPSSAGLLAARCQCGKFLPAMALTGRSKLTGTCTDPNCGCELIAPNNRLHTMLLIGGNQAGKTAYIAALQHQLRTDIPDTDKLQLKLWPQKEMTDLEAWYQMGAPRPSAPNQIGKFLFVFRKRFHINHQSLLIYDIPDECIINENYPANPVNFGYADSVVLMVDPLQSTAVQNDCRACGDLISLNSGSTDDPAKLIAAFARQFAQITGTSAGNMIKTPLAVVIAKSDIKPVRKEIGGAKIRSEFKKDPTAYQNQIENAENALCRAYLAQIGMNQLINQAESSFKTVRYYSVSALGHPAGQQAAPMRILTPVLWLAEKDHAGFVPELRASAAKKAEVTA